MDSTEYSAFKLANTIIHPVIDSEQVDVNTDPLASYYNEVFENARNTEEPIKPHYGTAETIESEEYPLLHFVFYIDAVIEAINTERVPYENVIQGLATLAYSKQNIQFLIENGTLTQEDLEALNSMMTRVLASNRDKKSEIKWYATPFLITGRLLNSLEDEADERAIDINELKKRLTGMAQGLPQTYLELFGEDILNIIVKRSLH